jgi:hypothetical protein
VAGRKPQNVEFFNKLRSLSGHFKVSDCAAPCGRSEQKANFSQYLSGKKIPQENVLGEGLRSLFGWQVVIHQEIQLLPKPLSKLSKAPGVYALYDSTFHLVYIGEAANLYTEINQTLNRNVPGLVGRKIKDRAAYLSAYEIHNTKLRLNIEALLIRIVGHQTYNSDVESFIP